MYSLFNFDDNTKYCLIYEKIQINGINVGFLGKSGKNHYLCKIGQNSAKRGF